MKTRLETYLPIILMTLCERYRCKYTDLGAKQKQRIEEDLLDLTLKYFESEECE